MPEGSSQSGAVAPEDATHRAPAAATPSRARRALLTLLSVLLFAAIIEGTARYVENQLAASGVVYHPPSVDGYEAYLAERDPLLGWPGRTPSADRDASGSRIVPAFADPEQPACMSFYGDSFAWGAEVSPEAAWGNLLSQRLGCRVANFGVPGYGTDQSYLRFKTNDGDRTPLVALCHMSENIERNLNQFRAFLYSGRQFGLKPRFVLNAQGNLELVPLPDLTPERFALMLRYPSRLLTHETMLPGTQWGPTLGRWPHTFTLLAALRNQRILSFLAGRMYWNDFYEPDHPTQGLQLTTAILETFAGDARQQGRLPVVILFPTYGDLTAKRSGKPWSYQPLVDLLRTNNVTTLNVGDELFARLPEGDPAPIASASGLHYNEMGNRIVADIVARFIEERHLLKPTPSPP